MKIVFYIITYSNLQKSHANADFILEISEKAKKLCWSSLLIKLKVGMSSLFMNLILKTSHYLHMKVLNEKIARWAHLSFYDKWFSRFLHLRFEKEVIFLGRFSLYEIPESGDKISNF